MTRTAHILIYRPSPLLLEEKGSGHEVENSLSLSVSIEEKGPAIWREVENSLSLSVSIEEKDAAMWRELENSVSLSVSIECGGEEVASG